MKHQQKQRYSNEWNIKQNQSNIDRRQWTFRKWQINLPRILRFWSMHQSEVMWILVTWGSQAVSRVGRGQNTSMTFHQLHPDSQSVGRQNSTTLGTNFYSGHHIEEKHVHNILETSANLRLYNFDIICDFAELSFKMLPRWNHTML